MPEQSKRPPTGEEIQRFQNAILSGYDYSPLKQMVRFELDADLEQIIPTRDLSFSDVTNNLVRYYAAQPGGLIRLARASLNANLGNSLIEDIVEEFEGVDFDILPLPEDWPAPTLRIPRWLLVTAAAVLLVGLLIVSQLAQITWQLAPATATPIPTPTPVVMPDGHFNIAVAELTPLDEIVRTSGETAKFSRDIANFLGNQTDELTKISWP